MKKYALPNIQKAVETVVLANGNFPTHPIALHMLNNCKNLVSCDGATNKLVKTGRIPNAIVGDLDSLSNENKVKFASLIHHVKEQETNDQTKAVNYCISQKWKDITILGATGQREDHTIGNVSLLCEYMHLANVQMITDYGIFIAIDSTTTLESYKGQQVSIFCLDKMPISSHGLRYKIDNQIFTRWWQASLNEAEGDEFTIETEGAVLVYREFAECEK